MGSKQYESSLAVQTASWCSGRILEEGSRCFVGGSYHTRQQLVANPLSGAQMSRVSGDRRETGTHRTSFAQALGQNQILLFASDNLEID
eukprot:4368154-Pleurochrysis_carterae.AAC.2